MPKRNIECVGYRDNTPCCVFATSVYRDGTAGAGGPGGRIGHSIVLAGNGSRVIMFGGRDNEIVRQHIPRTYEVW